MEDLTTREMPLGGGQRLDRFILDEEIGPRRINYPTHIYRAHDETTGQQVALKVLTVSYDQAQSAQQSLTRFIREARIMQRLADPHVLPLLEVGYNPEHYWIVMPYCSKGTLAQYLERRHHVPLPVSEACLYTMQVCRALSAAHTQNPPIIHRDIKPHNLFFNDELQLLLADFGIAHIMYDRHLTQNDKAIGTPEYMAPEQLRIRPNSTKEVIGPPLDIYALGCVLYEMLAGQPPFVGESAQAVGLAHLSHMPHPLPAINSHVNLGLWLIVRIALGKLPEERYSSAAAFARALQPFVED